MTIHQPTPAVRESFREAQQQAAAMVAGPPTAWNEAARARRRSPLWIGLATASVVAGGVAGWLGVDWLGTPAPARPATSPETAARTFAQATPAPMPAPAPATPLATIIAAPSLAVTRQAGVIRIASTNASLADAVRALAQATHTNVKGGEALASIASPITLNWQGNDTAAAWDALLGRFASIAVSCANAACELWVVGVNAPRVAGGSPAGPATAPTGVAPLPAPQPAAATTQSIEEVESN